MRGITAGLAGVIVLLAGSTPVFADPSPSPPPSSSGGNGDGFWGAAQKRGKTVTVEGSRRSNGRAGSSSTGASAPNYILITKKHYDDKAIADYIKQCVESGNQAVCDEGLINSVNGDDVPTQVRIPIESIVQRAIAQLTIPADAPNVGPPPSINEWKMAAVGYPLWLWTDDPASLHSSHSVSGLTVSLTATRGKTTFRMGDGSSVTCTTMTKWSKRVEPATKSPTCGYTYTTPSLPKGNYTVTASTQWSIGWRVMGVSGTIPMTVTSAGTDLPVGELQSVVIER